MKSNRFIIYFFICQIYLVLSQLHVFLLWQRTPENHIFTFDHIAYTSMDHNMYLSAINQGKNGQWRMTDNHTSENTNPSWFYWFYPLLGKLTAFTNLETFYIYLFAKIIFSELLMLSYFFLAKTFLPSKFSLHGALICLMFSAFPYYFADTKIFAEYEPWWYRFDGLVRPDTMPHYQAAWMLQNFIYILFYQQLVKTTWKRTILISVLSLIAGLFLPSAVISLGASILALGILKVLNNPTTIKVQIIGFLKHTVVMLPAAALPLLLANSERFNGLPWSTWSLWDREKWIVQASSYFTKDMFLLYIMLLVLALPVVIIAIRKKTAYLLLAAWGFFPFLLILLAPFFDLGMYRIACMAPYIPLGILAVGSISKIYTFNKNIPLLMLFIIYTGFISVTYPLLMYSIQMAKTFPLHEKMFIPVARVDTLKFLDQKAAPGSITLAEFITGNVIPVFTKSKTFIGHMVHTVDYFDKAILVSDFYSGKMDPVKTKEFLFNFKISYIIVEPIHKNLDLAIYPYLIKIYENQGYSIFSVNL